MTKLELLPRKAFQLTLSDGTVVEGQYGTWALARFGQKRKLGLEETIILFNSVQIMDMLEFILCAIECKEREAGKPPSMNELKLSKFIDDYAADHNESGVLMRLFNHQGNEEELSGDPEKKNYERPTWGKLQRRFYSAGGSVDEFWKCTLEEVELFIRGNEDKWRVQRACAYKIAESFRGSKHMPLITQFLPLPYDFEYGSPEQISQEQADQLMKDYEQAANEMRNHKWN